jgi:hypothetical protein
MKLHLLQHGYPHVNIAPERTSRLSYYEAFDAAHTGSDPHAFHAFIVGRERDALHHYLQILRQEGPPPPTGPRTPPQAPQTMPSRDER